MSAGKLPEGWVNIELNEIASDISYGYTASSSVKREGPHMLRITDIQNNTVNWSNVPFCQIEDKQKEKYLLADGDLVFARTGATVGKSFLIKGDIPESIYASYLIRVRCNGRVNKNFLSYFFRSPEYWSQITELSAGIGQPNVNGSKLKKLILPITSTNEQKIIAEKLDTLLAQVDSTQARLEQILQILKRFRQAVLAAAMRGELSETWRTHNSFNISLHKYYELTKGKKLKAKNIAEPCEENTWLRCNIGHIFNVKSGDGLTAKEMNSSGDIPVYGGNGITGYHDKYNTEESTIVIGRVGYYCGSVHLTPEKSWITDNALLVDFNRDLITEKFAYWLLKATNLRVDTSSSAQPVISGAKIYSIEIVVPPVEEQHEIVRRVEQLFAYADTIEKQVNNALARVNNLTQSILAKAFRGELTAQWRAENPELISGENSAAALLEKIKAERAASGGKKASRKKS
ncbi:restriction endonuclease subunit S [Escherichia marmotae]|uniref:restriction endonuclease subunit S n=1 Tax=Escherichia marmotae TaxID=1499973 RepID=UPI001E4DA99A|nr:restriction endonuclease subunit S [Escherichia marmotae]MEC9693709.1 restriction endonuclease subunit S [Escherichia marmotae]MEC9800645.1 restriction endonuclease subunit S [Escherichia marmotae]MEC9882676.1 restriction endonuclease subunit S [Escherichia marmotae]MED9303943.1 restriction endonuclease subunit S [Escherichia marmotae]